MNDGANSMEPPRVFRDRFYACLGRRAVRALRSDPDRQPGPLAFPPEPLAGVPWLEQPLRCSPQMRDRRGRLGWTISRVLHPEQADRWTWLMLAACAQLRLPRTIVEDNRLPWERALPPGSLNPGSVLRRLATPPARAPKPRGRSPGRPKGYLSEPAKRSLVVKKAA